jgi:L-malate glycosyltransferase
MRDSTIRVLLVAPSLDIVGGQSVQAERLLAQLRQDRSLEVTFLPLNPRLPHSLAQIPFLRTFARLLLFLPSLFLKVTQHDIIHVFSASYWSYTLWSLPAVVAGRLFGKKVILNYRSGEAEDHLAHWRSAVPGLMLAHEIVAPSKYLVDVFAQFGLASRRIPNILDTTRFHYRRRSPLRPVFLTNRGLEPLYNVDCVLRAFQIVQQRYPDASLAVAHDGSCRPHLEALARELGLRNTRFLGYVPQAKMPELYDAADICLMSPNLDCLPGSILESFASGLPVVATKAGGIPYLVKHEQTGLLVACDDHGALADCALWLLEDRELAARLSEQGLRESEKYKPESVRAAWVDLYHRLLGRPSEQTASEQPAEQVHEEALRR